MKLNTRKIKDILESRDMSVDQLARKMKCTNQWAYRILKFNKKSRTFKTVGRFAKALGVKATDLIED